MFSETTTDKENTKMWTEAKALGQKAFRTTGQPQFSLTFTLGVSEACCLDNLCEGLSHAGLRAAAASWAFRHAPRHPQLHPRARPEQCCWTRTTPPRPRSRAHRHSGRRPEEFH